MPLETHPTPENIQYLRAKRAKLGHLLDGLDDYVDGIEEETGGAERGEAHADD